MKVCVFAELQNFAYRPGCGPSNPRPCKLYSRSQKIGNPIASILKSNVKGISALFGLSPVSNFMGFTVDPRNPKPEALETLNVHLGFAKSFMNSEDDHQKTV